MRRTGEKGGQLVELAVLLPLLVLLLLGTMHFGYTFFVYVRLEKAVHDAARYAAMRTYQASDVESFRTSVANVVVKGTPDYSGAEVVEGLSTATVDVAVTPGPGGAPSQVTVTITSYEMPLNLYLWNSNLTGKPSATYPFMGRYAP